MLPLHHKRVVENNTPSTFRRELFIDIYIFCRLYASRKSNPRLQLFLFSLPKKKKKKKKKDKKGLEIKQFFFLLFFSLDERKTRRPEKKKKDPIPQIIQSSARARV